MNQGNKAVARDERDHGTRVLTRFISGAAAMNEQAWLSTTQAEFVELCNMLGVNGSAVALGLHKMPNVINADLSVDAAIARIAGISLDLVAGLLAAALATLLLAWQLICEKPWRLPFCWTKAVLAVPGLWWRWQKLYWLATPVILAIVTGFAASLDWS